MLPLIHLSNRIPLLVRYSLRINPCIDMIDEVQLSNSDLFEFKDEPKNIWE